MKLSTKLFASFCLVLTIACGPDQKDMFDQEIVDQYNTNKNGSSIFGAIDPAQDWNTLQTGQVTVTADAALEGIVKVQILSMPPFGTDEARVLNEVSARSGDQVTLCYDAPSVSDRLFAACVNAEGICYIKGFSVGQKQVKFSTNGARAMRRAAFQLPEASKLVLQRSWTTHNKFRADNAWGLWAGSGWDDTCYALDDKVEQMLIETVSNYPTDEQADLQKILDTYLGVKAGKPDNLSKVMASKIFSMDNNYLTADGGVVSVTPVNMSSGETRNTCWVYYFYYDPAIMAGKSEAEQVAILKRLPKYKAIQCYRVGRLIGSTYKANEIFRNQVFYCPYYGDSQPTLKQTAAVSLNMPRGYKIGFVQRMQTDNKDWKNKKAGELYGDGRLNTEINQLPDHFTSANLAADAPRQAIFSVNGKAYVTFEDGSDRTFNDLIVEVGGVSTDAIDEAPEPEAEVYTMCFEDRPLTADYDLNDVVLTARRVSATQIQISLTACGAQDRVVLHGISGSTQLEGREVHDIFQLSDNQFYVNTEAGGLTRTPVSETVTVSSTMTISDFLKNIYIENTTDSGNIIRLPKTGGSPYAIIVPNGFNYPQELECITKAYPTFLNWAQDAKSAKDWYCNPAGNVYTNPGAQK